MMGNLFISLLIAALAVEKGLTAPTPLPPPPPATAPNGRQCVKLEIPLKVNINSTHWIQPKVDSNVDAVDWVDQATTWTSPGTLPGGPVTISGTFKITGQLCVPRSGKKADVLQIATHGVGFDSRYWDVEIKPKDYSYVEAALAEGYSIFTYDRLGVGGSDKPDAYDIVQTDVQIEILRQLTVLARAGTLIKSSNKVCGTNCLDNYTPSKIVHVGHSYGSVLIIGLLENYGTLSDGAICTGFLYNSQLNGSNVATWGFEFAKESDPKRFGDRGSGYIVQATKSNVQLSFFKKGAFEPALLDYAEKIKQPNSITEFASIGTVFYRPAPAFKGPLQFVIGEHDYGFCRGDCKGTYDAMQIMKDLYPAAKDVSVHLQPGTGHGLTLATNATAGYKVTFDYLHSFGL